MQKGTLALRGVLPGIAAVRRWTDRPCSGESASQASASGKTKAAYRSRLAGHAVNRAAKATGRLIFSSVELSYFVFIFGEAGLQIGADSEGSVYG